MSPLEEYDSSNYFVDPFEVVIPKISEAFNMYDTFGTMGDSSRQPRITLDFLMNEAQWNYDSNDQFKTNKCGFVIKGW